MVFILAKVRSALVELCILEGPELMGIFMKRPFKTSHMFLLLYHHRGLYLANQINLILFIFTKKQEPPMSTSINNNERAFDKVCLRTGSGTVNTKSKFYYHNVTFTSISTLKYTFLRDETEGASLLILKHGWLPAVPNY